MWLRDSANQLQSYVSLLKPPSSEKSSSSSSSSSSNSDTKQSQQPGSGKLASLFRGAINLQSRYILASPHCNAFQPPVESGLAPADGGHRSDFVSPPYSDAVVFECKYELDSLASFLQLSWDYYSRTKDARFFVDASSGGSTSSANNNKSPGGARRKGSGKVATKGGGSSRSSGSRNSGSSSRAKKRTSSSSSTSKKARKAPRRGAMDGWKDAVEAILATAEAMRTPTYKEDGMVPDAPYRFTRVTSASTETLPNGGNGSPVKGGTGLVRSAFRPSDDATTFQFLIPANMMLARYMGLCAEIVERVEKEEARVAAALEAAAAAAAAVAEASSSSSSKGSGGSGSSQDVVGGTTTSSSAEDYYDDELEDEEEDDDDDEEPLADRMRRMAKEIKKGIETYGKIKHPEFGEIYAYEVDGYYSTSMMVSNATLPHPLPPLLSQRPITNTMTLSPGRRKPPLPPLLPTHRLRGPHRPNLQIHPPLRPLRLKPLLRPRARDKRHGGPPHRPRNGMAHVACRGDHDERRRRRDQEPARPAVVVDRRVGPHARERQRLERGHVDARLVQLGQRAVWADDPGPRREEAGGAEE